MVGRCWDVLSSCNHIASKSVEVLHVLQPLLIQQNVRSHELIGFWKEIFFIIILFVLLLNGSNGTGCCSSCSDPHSTNLKFLKLR